MAGRLASLAVLALVGSLACGGGTSGTSPTPTASSSPSANPSPTPLANTCGAPSITPAASAPALVRASIAYDTARRQFILLGTRNGANVSETWAWTAASGWQHLAPATNPTARTWGNMAYDDATRQIVLFAGQTATITDGVLNLMDDTWTWDGTNWTQRAPAKSPPPTIFLPMAYDVDTQTVIGVRDNDPVTTTSTWQWDGSSWGTIATTGHPAWPKQGAGIAYSTVPSAIVMFGTVYGLGVTTDAKTWTFTPNKWVGHVATAGSPKPRFFPAMSQDTGGGIVMFGGAAGGGAVYGDTWSWSHNLWQKLSPSTSPRARGGAVMAYDPNCGRALLYGGEAGSQVTVAFFKDSWVWDGQTWTKV
jgi:hypothetical protein